MSSSADVSTIVGLILWTSLFPALLFFGKIIKVPSVGLGISYIALFFIGHAPGALLYLFPWYFTYYDGLPVTQGFQLSVIGALSFFIGLVITTGTIRFVQGKVAPSTTPLTITNRLPQALFALGLLTYLVLVPIGGRIPSISAVLSNLTNLQVVGVVLGLYVALKENNLKNLVLWSSILPLLPLLTVTTAGFLGFGIGLVMVVVAFIVTKIRFRWWHIVVAIVGVYVGLSLYVTYMDARGEIRSAVWGGEDYSTRLDTVGTEFGRWQWFDWRDQDHLFLIDGRLNQNSLIGVAKFNLDSGLIDFANGETLQRAWVGFIPRAIWPDKPIMAGGNDIVSQYTFLEFAVGTSVAMGQVMEFFVNYGERGVIIGFFILGVIFSWIDARAAHYLEGSDFYGFLRWYLPGLAMLKPLDDFSVVTAGAASALVAALLLEFVMKRWEETRTTPSPDIAVDASKPRALSARP